MTKTGNSFFLTGSNVSIHGSIFGRPVGNFSATTCVKILLFKLLEDAIVTVIWVQVDTFLAKILEFNAHILNEIFCHFRGFGSQKLKSNIT